MELQAAVFEGFEFDLLPLVEDGLCPAEVGIGRRYVTEALVVAMVVVVNDESADLRFKITLQVVVFQQDAVLEGLVSSLGRFLRQALSRPVASSAISTVAVTSSYFMPSHSFQATT